MIVLPIIDLGIEMIVVLSCPSAPRALVSRFGGLMHNHFDHLAK